MLYKVTPMMPPPAPKDAKARESREAGQPRKRRKSAIFDAEGQEVLISLMCIKCKSLKPLAQFGLRKMADGAIRNQPWCRTCRSGAGKPKEKAGDNVATLVQAPAVAATLQVVPAPAVEDDEPSIAVASQG
ncbi:MAG: hypothetical protein ABW123_04885 [Cystobacter sp.]